MTDWEKHREESIRLAEQIAENEREKRELEERRWRADARRPYIIALIGAISALAVGLIVLAVSILIHC